MKKLNLAFKIHILLQGLFYFGAGINHFLNPNWYLPLIPEYFPQLELMNFMAGAAEVILALMIFFKPTRLWASYGLSIMLLVFSLSHIHFIHHGSCFEGSLCTAPWVGWVRLIIIHPLLIFWTRKILDFTDYQGK